MHALANKGELHSATRANSVDTDAITTDKVISTDAMKLGLMYVGQKLGLNIG